MNIFITKDGNRQGPYSLPEVQQLKNSGKIQDTDWAWYEGIADWIPVAQIPGLIASPFKLPPAPPATFAAVGAPAREPETPWAARILTGIVVFGVSFVILFMVISFFTFLAGGMISGYDAAIAQHAQTQSDGQRIGQMAGREFVHEYGKAIAGYSALASFLLSAGLAWLLGFTNLLPWCRRR